MPLRGAVTIVSDAPIRSARSCMLVMPNPGRRSRAMPRPSSATDRRSPTDCTVEARIGDPPCARMADGVGQRFLRDRHDLALDAVAEAGQFVDDEIDRHAGRPLAHVGQALERGRDVLAAAHVRTQRADRSPRFRQMRARQVDGGLDARGDRRRQDARLPLRRLQLHQDGRESLRQVVVNVARETVALFEDRLAPLLAPILLDETAVVQRQRRLTRDRLDQHDAPPLALGL